MARTTETTKSVSVTDKSVVLPPAVQRLVKNLRDARDLDKKAKELSQSARQQILDFIGEVAESVVATDARGKRLVSVKVIPSAEKIDFERMEQENPELFALVQTYKVPRGANSPTIRVDVL